MSDAIAEGRGGHPPRYGQGEVNCAECGALVHRHNGSLWDGRECPLKIGAIIRCRSHRCVHERERFERAVADVVDAFQSDARMVRRNLWLCLDADAQRRLGYAEYGATYEEWNGVGLGQSDDPLDAGYS